MKNKQFKTQQLHLLLHFNLVFSQSCAVDGCRCIAIYDGGEDAILHMTNVCIHHSVLRDYMNHFLMGNGYVLFYST